ALALDRELDREGVLLDAEGRAPVLAAQELRAATRLQPGRGLAPRDPGRLEAVVAPHGEAVGEVVRAALAPGEQPRRAEARVAGRGDRVAPHQARLEAGRQDLARERRVHAVDREQTRADRPAAEGKGWKRSHFELFD